MPVRGSNCAKGLSTLKEKRMKWTCAQRRKMNYDYTIVVRQQQQQSNKKTHTQATRSGMKNTATTATTKWQKLQVEKRREESKIRIKCIAATCVCVSFAVFVQKVANLLFFSSSLHIIFFAYRIAFKTWTIQKKNAYHLLFDRTCKNHL